MNGSLLFSEKQMERIAPFFPLSLGVPLVDDRRVLPAVAVRQNRPNPPESTVAKPLLRHSTNTIRRSPS